MPELAWNKNTRGTRVFETRVSQNKTKRKKKIKNLTENFFFSSLSSLISVLCLWTSLLLSRRSSPNQASKTKAHHRGSLLILLPIFLGQNPRSKPMNFLPLFLGSNRDEFIGFRFAFYDQDEVVVHLLCLVLQVPIRAFVGFVFGFTGEMFMWGLVKQTQTWKDLKVRPGRMLYRLVRNWR